MDWTTLTLQVTTPLFNGGADLDDSARLRPDQEAGIRAASIRGAMRFWFRALAGALTVPDLSLLAALERRVFGGIAGAESSQASPLILRVPEPPRPSLDAPFLQGSDGRWIGYLLGLGLMKPGQRRGLLRPCVLPETDPFELKIGFRHGRSVAAETRQAIEALAVASLWLACAYGGFGARIRRGFGGLRIVDASGDLPQPWTPTCIRTPGLGLYESAEWVRPWNATVFGVFEQHIRTLINEVRNSAERLEADRWTEPPDFPVLSRKYSPAAIVPRPFSCWQEALVYGGRQLRLFRANGTTDPGKRQRAQVRTAEWSQSVNGNSTAFPVGALGLPVGYKDKKNNREFRINAIQDEPNPEELRRASPLWLRPVGSGDSWRLFTFAFRARFLPEQARIYLVRDRQAARDKPRIKELETGASDVERLTAQWLETMRVGGDFASVIRS